MGASSILMMPGSPVSREFRSVFLISKARPVPEAVKYLREGSRVGDVELDFFARSYRSAARRTFKVTAPSAGAAEANQLATPRTELAGVGSKTVSDSSVRAPVSGIAGGSIARRAAATPSAQGIFTSTSRLVPLALTSVL